MVGEEETEALLGEFPARASDTPATKDFVQIQVGELRAETLAGFREEAEARRKLGEDLSRQITESSQRLDDRITSTSERLDAKITESSERLDDRISDSSDRLGRELRRVALGLAGLVVMAQSVVVSAIALLG